MVLECGTPVVFNRNMQQLMGVVPTPVELTSPTFDIFKYDKL
ncbi:MAG: hypothetical protein C5S49_00940 [Candidatus Methanogaster sp.]|nr:MAG: hypothetical protein C5S49_00940 [ANME-2 cluster archaeon]